MKHCFLNLCLMLIIPFISYNVSAEEETENTELQYVYFAFDPELVTNYISSRGKMGYIRASIELMVKSPSDLSLLEFHEPLLRATLIDILGSQQAQKIKSLTGRETIRQESLETLNRLLKQETGEAPIVNLLITRYLYD